MQSKRRAKAKKPQVVFAFDEESQFVFSVYPKLPSTYVQSGMGLVESALDAFFVHPYYSFRESFHPSLAALYYYILYGAFKAKPKVQNSDRYSIPWSRWLWSSARPHITTTESRGQRDRDMESVCLRVSDHKT